MRVAVKYCTARSLNSKHDIAVTAIFRRVHLSGIHFRISELAIGVFALASRLNKERAGAELCSAGSLDLFDFSAGSLD